MERIHKILGKMIKSIPNSLIDIIISYAELSMKDKFKYMILYSKNYEISIPITETRKSVYFHTRRFLEKEEYYNMERDLTLYIEFMYPDKQTINANNIDRYLEKTYIIVYAGPNVYRYKHKYLDKLNFNEFYDMIYNKNLEKLKIYKYFFDTDDIELEIENYIKNFNLESCNPYPFISQLSKSLT